MNKPIDADIQKLASSLAHKAFDFVRETTGDPCLESASQWSSLENAIAAPIQRLRDYAQKKREYNETWKLK